MKKTLVLVCAVLSAGIFLSSCTINRPQETTRKITVKGSSTVNVDSMVLTFTVKTREMDKEAAESKNKEIFAKLQETVSDSGIDMKDLSSEVKTDTEKGPKVWVKEESGEWVGKDDYFSVTNTVKVTVRDVTKSKNLKDSVLQAGAGAVSLTNAKYLAADTASSLRQSRSLAVQNAQDSANLLAGASGCKVAKVLEIREEETVYSQINAKAILSETMPGAVPATNTGNAAVTTNVTITYTLMD